MSPEVLRYAAFTDHGRGGNPAGVVLDAHSLTGAQMLTVARTIGYPETAFVTGRGTVRFFSPAAEIAFGEHATVAAAFALAERSGPGRRRLTTRRGAITVTTRVEDGDLVASLISPPATTRPLGEGLLHELLDALRWRPEHLDPHFPVHVAYAGSKHVIVAAGAPETLDRPDHDLPALARLMRREGWSSPHLFRAEGATSFHASGAFPATVGAAAAFGGYLRELGLVPVPTRVIVRQGHDTGSPSRLLIDLDNGTAGVRVSGHAARIPLSPYDIEEGD
nr:PhzF family phenazine biosynthesis isomerase [uncultured Actinoplanes sp.]